MDSNALMMTGLHVCPFLVSSFLLTLRVCAISKTLIKAFRASILLKEDYTFRLRIRIFAYKNCEMPIFDVDILFFLSLALTS